ncbi:MAG TPA: hypothetical protein ENJ18_14395, partial [Nannocystis exedens]|nr:hypothetical protein [Nannocystis exedens]
EFVRRSDEEAYRLATARESHGRIQTIALGLVLLTGFMVTADRGITEDLVFLKVVLLRVMSTLPIFIVALRRPPKTPWGMSRIAFGLTLFYIGMMLVIASLLPPRPVAMTVWSTFLLMVYLLPPLRMYAAVFAGSLVMLAVFTVVPLPWPIDHPETRRALMMMGGLSVLGALTLRSLERSRRAEFALLSRILPRSVIPRLRGGERVVDRVDSASILFADLVGFSRRSATMEATAVVEMLEELFAALDTLVAVHGAEKIKTIGDCYMAAAGIPDPRPDHAQILARVALDMVVLVESRTFAGHQLRLRIGLHCGPVAAGIIGRDRFLYDVWGETVNTAQRMESMGAADLIVVTPEFAAAVAGDFELEAYDVVRLKDGTACEARRLVRERSGPPV